MKHHDNGDKRFKAVKFSNINDFEHQLNSSEEDGWTLHSWNFCDNSYNVTYVALVVRDASRILTEET